jgi:quercetin dioxygenase-like cupin family protein
MKTVRLRDVEKVEMTMEGAKDVWRQLAISSLDGAPNFSFRVFTVEPGGHTPYHAHPFEHLNYVISGSASLVNEKGEEKEVRTGDFALVLPNEKHQYKNTSTAETFVMICAVPKAYE